MLISIVDAPWRFTCDFFRYVLAYHRPMESYVSRIANTFVRLSRQFPTIEFTGRPTRGAFHSRSAVLPTSRVASRALRQRGMDTIRDGEINSGAFGRSLLG